MTISDKLAHVLISHNLIEQPSRSKKYRKFEGLRPGWFYWLGKNGALRVGLTSTDSVPINELTKKRLLATYKEEK